jgi:tetratricopeptide (TPR) repeat protein
MRIAVQLDGSNPHGRAYFAGLLVSRGELAEAEPHIRAAIERDPGVWVFHLILGMLLVAKGDADQAINALQTAARLNPSHPGVHYQLAHHLFKQGHFAEAATALQRVIDLDGRNAQAFAQMGHLRFRLGQLDDAERCLRHAISLDSNVAMYHLALGHTLFHLDRGNEALKSARQAAVLAPDDPACKRFVDFVTTRTVPFIPMETDRHVIAKRQFETEFVMETIETQASNAVVTLEQDEPKHETKSRGGTSLWLKLLNVGRHGTLLADGRSR